MNPNSFERLYNLDKILYYRTRSINKELAYSILPDGCVAIHFWDSLPTLDFIYFWGSKRGFYDRFREIEDKDVVIDCGAHVGIFTLKAAKRAKHGKVIAIEPETRNYEILKSNVKNNRLTNVVTVKSALTSKKSGEIRLYLHNLSEGHSLKVLHEDTRRFATYTKVQSNTLDDIAEAYGIDHADIIKMSVNAAEMDVIKGGGMLLRQSRYLVIEIDRKLTQVEDLANLLFEYGFKKVVRDYRLGSKMESQVHFERAHANKPLGYIREFNAQ